MKNKKASYYVIATLGIALYVFLNSTNLNPIYYEGAMFYGLVLTIYILIWVFNKIGNVKIVRLDNGAMKLDFGKGEFFPKPAKFALIFIWGFIIFMSIMSTALLNVNKYKNQMPEAQPKEFNTEIQPFDTNKIPIVDKFLASQLADKKLGERQSLGSQVYVGEPTIQIVNGDLVWAVPLHHSGIFKWLTNMSGTPGYIVVSATNTQDVDYVEGYKIKYHPNSYLMDDLTRYTRFNGAFLKGITDYSFELDDDGQPYWVITTYVNKAGFALPEADGVIIVNASNGDLQKHTLENVPEWVDRVQPERFIINQINNKGEYIRGLFNFSNKDKYRTSKGHMIVYNEGKSYLFTGLTSVGADESAIGFIMVDMVTKEPKMYQLSGATEEAAQKSAQGNVQQFGYRASFPLILNIDGVPSYFMTLKDSGGLIKQFAIVSLRNYLLVGVGETVDSALTNYHRIIKSNGLDTESGQSSTISEIEGKVIRIASSIDDGTSIYKLIIDGKQDVIFTASSSISDEISLTRDGDIVKISYNDNSENKVIPAITFDNLSIN
ncbi:MAG: hypothetical protein ACRCZK_05310 [Oscillospiraceae bacterium]